MLCKIYLYQSACSGLDSKSSSHAKNAIAFPDGSWLPISHAGNQLIFCTCMNCSGFTFFCFAVIDNFNFLSLKYQNQSKKVSKEMTFLLWSKLTSLSFDELKVFFLFKEETLNSKIDKRQCYIHKRWSGFSTLL